MEKYRNFSLFIILIPTSDFPHFYYMLGGNLGSLLYGDVSVMYNWTLGLKSLKRHTFKPLCIQSCLLQSRLQHGMFLKDRQQIKKSMQLRITNIGCIKYRKLLKEINSTPQFLSVKGLKLPRLRRLFYQSSKLKNVFRVSGIGNV